MGKPGMPMVWIVLIVIGMVLLLGWLVLGQFGGPRDRVTDPAPPTTTAPHDTPDRPLDPDPRPDPDPLPPP